MITIKDKLEGAIRGGAIGDALGLPFETKTHKEISEVFGEVKEYIPIKNHGIVAKNLAKGKRYTFDPEETGIISDDTIFTMAGMNTITEKGTIDMQTLFDAHKILFDRYGDGLFGGKTSKKFEEYTLGGDISQLYNDSYGNGVLMKQFPYAAYFYALQQKSQSTGISASEIGAYIDNTMGEIIKTTHDTKIAQLVSILHNKTLIYLLSIQPEDFNAKTLLGKLSFISPIWEKILDNNETKKVFDTNTNMNISPIIEKLLIQQKSIEAGKPYTYDEILENYMVCLDEKKDSKINKKIRPGFHVASTFGLVYACFLQNQNFQGLIDAIQIGEDTDSQGAVIGNMIGALNGPFYEEKYIEGIKDKVTIQESFTNFQNKLSQGTI